MKEAYPEDNIMLCFVQGFGNGSENSCDKTYEYNKDNVTAGNNNLRPSKKNQHAKRVSLQEVSTKSEISYPLEEVPVRSRALFTGKSIRLSSEDRFHNLPEVNRSFSDRFSITSDAGGKRSSKGFLTIRKTCKISATVRQRRDGAVTVRLRYDRDATLMSMQVRLRQNTRSFRSLRH